MVTVIVSLASDGSVASYRYRVGPSLVSKSNSVPLPDTYLAGCFNHVAFKVHLVVGRVNCK